MLDNTFAQVCSLLVQLQLLPTSRRGGVRDRGRRRRRLPRRHRSTRLVKVPEAYTLSGVLVYIDIVYPYLVYPYPICLNYVPLCVQIVYSRRCPLKTPPDQSQFFSMLIKSKAFKPTVISLNTRLLTNILKINLYPENRSVVDVSEKMNPSLEWRYYTFIIPLSLLRFEDTKFWTRYANFLAIFGCTD